MRAQSPAGLRIMHTPSQSAQPDADACAQACASCALTSSAIWEHVTQAHLPRAAPSTHSSFVAPAVVHKLQPWCAGAGTAQGSLGASSEVPL